MLYDFTLKCQIVLTNLFLIVIIFSRLPKDSVGLSNSRRRGSFWNSPSSAERFANFVTALGISLYFVNVFQAYR